MKSSQKSPRQWFSLDKEAAELFIYDEIGKGFFGGGVAADEFIDEVRSLRLGRGDSLRLRINSPGGDVFDGNTIYNYLRSQSYSVSVHIDGVAASAASIVAMAGDTVSMPENSFLMIHNPWMFVAGDAPTLREAADNLDKIREGAVATYLSKVSDTLSKDRLIEMLDAETWLTAQEAVDYGFADEVTNPVKAAALLKYDFDKYGFHAPKVMEDSRKETMQGYRKEFDQLKLVQ